MTNYEEAVSAVLNEDDDRDPTLTQAETANQYSDSNQPTKSRQLKPNCDSLRNLNFYDNVLMKGWLEEIPYRSVAGLSIDGSHIKRNVFKSGRSLGMVNMRHQYAIGAWKTHIGAAGHKEGILSCEDRERRESLGNNIPNDSKQQQLVLAIFFNVKVTGSRFSRPVSKKKKCWRT